MPATFAEGHNKCYTTHTTRANTGGECQPPLLKATINFTQHIPREPPQVVNCILFYSILSIHLYSAFCSAHQSEALPVRETQREESSLERTKRGTCLTS